MGEFNAAVSTLIEAFGSGITIIKSLRRRRKESKPQIDSATKAEESRLSKSLKKNKVDVQSVYESKLERLGRRFADGDAKAHLSLTSILFRLNAGFVSIIDRFTQGESTRADYQMLVNLSNASRVEAIKTFEHLSARLSQSHITLSTTKPKGRTHGSSKGHKTAASQASRSSHARRVRLTHSRSTPTLSTKQTILGPATTRGWVRPKGQRRKGQVDLSPPRQKSEAHNHPKSPLVETVVFPSSSKHIPSQSVPPGLSNRMSIMSFASDSTKIGEIPERSGPKYNHDDQEHLANTAFPLAPWRRPEKPRSKFMRLFRK